MTALSPLSKVNIDSCNVSAYQIPTDLPEADGTLEWWSTTLVLVELEAGNKKGIGYTYADVAAATYIRQTLMPYILKADVLDIEATRRQLIKISRNNGTSGLTCAAISAVDIALWDLKSRLLDLPLSKLLGQQFAKIEVYASGGFTSYSSGQLSRQMSDWAEKGFKRMKMKIGQHPEKDKDRIELAKESIGQATLMIDANGAYSVKEALSLSYHCTNLGIDWFEEPVSSENIAGLAFIREHTPHHVNIAAGEYAYTLNDFLMLLKSQAVDMLQADATRCGGISGFMKAASLAEAFQIPFSSHCAPSVHLHPATAVAGFCFGEYFHDHVRIESLLFDGFAVAEHGMQQPDLSQPGLGLTFRHQDADDFLIR